MKFLVDNQLPAELARLFGSLGVECHHVLDLGLAQVPDNEIWRYADEHKMILITKDEDFFRLAGRPGSTVQVVWVRLGNCRTQVLLSAMRSLWPRIQVCLEAGDRVVEVR